MATVDSDSALPQQTRRPALLGRGVRWRWRRGLLQLRQGRRRQLLLLLLLLMVVVQLRGRRRELLLVVVVSLLRVRGVLGRWWRVGVAEEAVTDIDVVVELVEIVVLADGTPGRRRGPWQLRRFSTIRSVGDGGGEPGGTTAGSRRRSEAGPCGRAWRVRAASAAGQGGSARHAARRRSRGEE